MQSLYDLSFKDSYGNIISLEKYRNNILLMVNTATKCGLAGQFSQLEELHQKYKDKGLVVIGFPCNQFAFEEPVSNDKMPRVCQVNFGVTFLLSEKIKVNGIHTHPIFKILKDQASPKVFRPIKWNFTKFLIDKNAQHIHRYSPITSPEKLKPEIEKMLEI